MFDVHCAFHTDRQLSGLGVFQLTLGRESVLVCDDCARAFREGRIVLSGF